LYINLTNTVRLTKKSFAPSKRVPWHVPIICLVAISSISGLRAQQLLITNTTVVDVENKKILPSRDVWIQNGIINAIGKKLKPPTGTQYWMEAVNTSYLVL
jgi:adenine deaminase